jgi:hypothetical protein
MTKVKQQANRRRATHLPAAQLQARRAAAHNGTLAGMNMLKAVATTPEMVTVRPLGTVSPGKPWYHDLPQFARYRQDQSL